MLTAALHSNPLARLDVRAGIDIFIIAVMIYYLFKVMRGTRAVQILLTVLLLVGLYEAARWERLEMVEWLLTTLLPYLAIALIVLFQPEIRQGLARFGRKLTFAQFSSHSPAAALDDVVLAVNYFSENRIGALIAFERDVGLRTYRESGIPLNANLSYDLLLAIFRPGSPLHDGAVIVEGSRIATAACFLPLSLNPAISNQLGTRHRAAIGVTEESDAVTVVVSEQTGSISIAAGGAIEQGLTAEQLTDRLLDVFHRYRRTVGLPQAPAGERVDQG